MLSIILNNLDPDAQQPYSACCSVTNSAFMIPSLPIATDSAPLRSSGSEVVNKFVIKHSHAYRISIELNYYGAGTQNDCIINGSC